MLIEPFLIIITTLFGREADEMVNYLINFITPLISSIGVLLMATIEPRIQ